MKPPDSSLAGWRVHLAYTDLLDPEAGLVPWLGGPWGCLGLSRGRGVPPCVGGLLC